LYPHIRHTFVMQVLTRSTSPTKAFVCLTARSRLVSFLVAIRLRSKFTDPVS